MLYYILKKPYYFFGRCLVIYGETYPLKEAERGRVKTCKICLEYRSTKVLLGG